MALRRAEPPGMMAGEPPGGNASEARLHGAWLIVARVASGGVSLLALVMWLWGLPYRYAQLATVCVTAECGDQQATPRIAGLFHQAGLTVGFYSAYMGTVETLYAALFMTLAALIYWRRSDTVIGLLTVVLFTTFSVTQADADALASALPFWGGPVNLIQSISFITLAYFLYLFPDGRFAPRWTCYVALAWIPFFLIGGGVLPTDIFLVLLFGFLVLSLAAQIYRYQRVSSPRQRQQTKWVVSGVIVALVGSITILLGSNVLNPYLSLGAWGLLAVNTAPYVLSALIPISIGVSIARSHLWDLDALINKALVYGLLSAALAALFASLILGLETAAGRFAGASGVQPLALVISTLVVAAVVQPLRRRLQLAIDRRFYRRKYNAARALATFGASLRSEVELRDLSENLLAVVQETMQPARVSLWLRPMTGQVEGQER